MGGKDGIPSSLEGKIDEIIHLLRETEIPNLEIAKMFNVTDALISMINNGKRCFLKNETYPIRNKNIHEGNKCIDCGKIISQKAKRCKECNIKYRQRYIPVKDELLKIVLSTSFEQTGRKYGVSGNTIKKWLKHYGEPSMKEDLLKKYSPEKIKISKIENKIENQIEMSKDGNKLVFKNISSCVQYMSTLFDINKKVCRDGIHRVLKNKRKTYHGYFFKYID